MAFNSALYYPYTLFRNESWVKLAALHWDKIGRIIPPNYQHVPDPTWDNTTVQKLADLGIITDETPNDSEKAIVFLGFIKVLEDHEAQLVTKYGTVFRDSWPPADVILPFVTRRGSDPRLAYVDSGKMAPGLSEAFTRSGLAEEIFDEGDRYLGMHPKLFFVYMLLLAENMSKKRLMSPVAEDALDHLAVAGISAERVADALLDDVMLVTEQPTAGEAEEYLLNIAIQSVVPSNIESVSVDRIIDIRNDMIAEGEMALFSKYVENLVAGIQGLENLSDRTILKRELETINRRQIQPQLRVMEKRWKMVGQTTVSSAMGISVVNPSLAAALASHLALGPFAPIAAGVAALSFGLWKVQQDRQKSFLDLRDLQKPTVSYLFSVEQNLGPATLTDRLTNAARRFRFAPA